MSEFGSGIVVCLAKFSEHLNNLQAPYGDSELEKTYLKVYGSKKEAKSKMIEMWMNGASDHFYELDRNKAPAPLVELADLTLKIGHGFTGETWTDEHIEEIWRLWEKSCLAVDAMLGVEADWGEW